MTAREAHRRVRLLILALAFLNVALFAGKHLWRAM
jgi:hypothetical protein